MRWVFGICIAVRWPKPKPLFDEAIERLTSPKRQSLMTAEAFYNLKTVFAVIWIGVPDAATLRTQGYLEPGMGWHAGYHALAELDCAKGAWAMALEHLDHSLRFGVENLRARNLKTMVLRKLNRPDEADELLRNTLKLGPAGLVGETSQWGKGSLRFTDEVGFGP